MSQFYISEGRTRFVCDCGNPLQPFVNNKLKVYQCGKCGKKFNNPFHETNPYKIEKNFIHPPSFENFSGIEQRNLKELLSIIFIISLVCACVYFSIVFMNIIEPISFQLDSFYQTMIVVIVTLVSLVSIFTIFGKNRIRELNKDHVMDIQQILNKYSNKIVNISNVSYYKFETDVLDGLKKNNIDNYHWFFSFLQIDTLKLLEEKVVDTWFRKRILPLGLIISISLIIVIPLSRQLHSILLLEFSFFIFILFCCLIEVFSTFNYLFGVTDILSGRFKLLYYTIHGKKGFQVSKLSEMKTFNIYNNSEGGD